MIDSIVFVLLAFHRTTMHRHTAVPCVHVSKMEGLWHELRKCTYILKCPLHRSQRKNRIFHRSPIQTEKSQPEGKRIMPETRFTKFPALSVDPRVGISRSASETDD